MTLMPIDSNKRSTNTDAIWQLLYPTGSVSYGVIDLTSMLMVEQGRGMPPMHYNVQRGTYQHGETPINLRLDPRVIQIALASDHASRSQLYDNLARLLNRLNPGRNWSTTGVLTKCIYRKIMPGGRRQWRSDLVTTGGSKQITSATGRFAEWGLQTGEPFIILTGSDAGSYVVETVVNENTLTLTQEMAFTATGVEYRILTGSVMRDLKVLLEAGPVLEDDRQEDTLSLGDTVKLVAHDPLWYNPVLQSITWQVIDLSNLIFYEPVNWESRASFPIWFGSDFVSGDSALTYIGTWPARPMIIANGPFTKLTLENLPTGDKLSLVYTASVGEVVTIDLDALTVTNNFGSNLMRYMSTPYTAYDSDLITFGLYPDPQVAGGTNTIRISISDAVLNQTSATMNWYSRYIGV